MERKEGVINLKEKQQIILKALLEGKTQRQIASKMKISRTTISRYLQDYEKDRSVLMESDDIKLKNR